ncbi:hypothetical protein UNDKW_4098 [Undibacterium sp. KW1]|uniref:hypothetical protein n=1 Tax=Undibacterium sp. KW1 TaxID=2058624 RepID=UPI001331CC89|nr:hypothetical protein [Undibacterium sp. KW1]BBB62371.1 hypothetical protein UNDKW_4098 [Undibacterium sp. KW1]
MKNTRNSALIFLSFHIVTTLALITGQLMGVHWPYLSERQLMRLEIHPGFALASIFVSLLLLVLLWKKNEKTYRFMHALALAALVYGVFLMVTHMLVFGFLLAYGAVCIIRFSTPYGWQRVNNFFAHPGHHTGENGQ